MLSPFGVVSEKNGSFLCSCMPNGVRSGLLWTRPALRREGAALGISLAGQQEPIQI
jgi:hypothetical protein